MTQLSLTVTDRRLLAWWITGRSQENDEDRTSPALVADRVHLMQHPG